MTWPLQSLLSSYRRVSTWDQSLLTGLWLPPALSRGLPGADSEHQRKGSQVLNPGGAGRHLSICLVLSEGYAMSGNPLMRPSEALGSLGSPAPPVGVVGLLPPLLAREQSQLQTHPAGTHCFLSQSP